MRKLFKILTFVGCAVIVAQTATEGQAALIYQWNLNEGTGTSVASQVPKVDPVYGTFNTGANVTWQVEGPPPTYLLDGTTVVNTHSLSFGGTTTDFINFGTDTSLAPDAITVAVWAKKGAAATSTGQILARYSSYPGSYELGFVGATLEWRFCTATGADMRVGYAGSGYTPFTQFDDGKWHFLVGTYDGTTGSIYVDGRLITSLTTPPSTLNQPVDQPFNLGRRPFVAVGSQEPFPGWIGGPVLIYDTALTAGEVRYLMQAPEPSSLVLGALGALGLLWLTRRRYRQ